MVNGKTYFGVAEEKEKAAQQYEVHQQAGDNVGLVEARSAVHQERISAAKRRLCAHKQPSAAYELLSTLTSVSFGDQHPGIPTLGQIILTLESGTLTLSHQLNFPSLTICMYL